MRRRAGIGRIAVRRVIIIGAVVHVKYSNNSEKEYKVQEKDGKKYYVDDDGKTNYI